MTPSVYEGQQNEGTLAWDITGLADTPEKANSLQLQVKNSCNAAQGTTFMDYVYAEVRFSLPAADDASMN